MTVKQLSDGNPDGAKLGQSTTDLIAFYGSTPVVKQTLTGTVTLTAPVSVSAFGFASSAQANAIITAVAALQTMGLI